MREIKFEYGFESVNGIVKKVYALSEIPNIKQKCDVWNVFPVIYVRQFTGLKDKNGFDIYDGDIMNCGTKTLKVVFDNGCFRTPYLDEKGNVSNYRLGGWIESEVIGNIHEHPNLLK